MKIVMAADHNGFYLKNELSKELNKLGYEIDDAGDSQFDPKDDFPLFAARAVNELLAMGGGDNRAILICGSGQGMCMAANRFKGIRAALAWDTEEAVASRNDDDSNVLCLPSRVLTAEDALVIAKSWLETDFAKAPRFVRRINELDSLPEGI